MRIDALNRTPIPPEAEKSDQAKISQLAQSLATPDANRVEELRLQIQSGNYNVSAEAVAAAIIDSHLKE
jgi:flagellar biosynthesis anti-sigma factor FlgM